MLQLVIEAYFKGPNMSYISLCVMYKNTLLGFESWAVWHISKLRWSLKLKLSKSYIVTKIGVKFNDGWLCNS